jgi:hypothetical protein
MNSSTISRTALFVLLMATIAAGQDKTSPAYQKGTILGYDIRVDSYTSGGGGNMPVTTTSRRAKVYELKGAGLIYKVDYCGAFQAGRFSIGQTVDFRVDHERLYVLHDGDKEYKCKIEGTRAVEAAKPDAPAAPANPAPAAGPPTKP